MAGVFLAIFLGASGFLIFNEYQQSVDGERLSRLETTSSELDADIRELGHQALLASNGDTAAFDAIKNLQGLINGNIELLKSGDLANQVDPVPASANDKLNQLESLWSQVSPDVDVILANQDAVSTINNEVEVVNELTPELLVKTDEMVFDLINNEASIELINVASQQRFLTQRMKASVNEFVSGGPGWEDAATQFGQDVKLFG